MTTALIDTPRIAPRRAVRPDDELARAASRGDVAAFEALYERHHLALLSFSRHMLGSAHDAEDVVQHAFAAADAAFREDRVPASVRAWLYTVARNRCVSILRARRDDHELPDPGVPSAENLAQEVERREDLRELLADLRTLPDDQRAALLLAELGELSHAEVAQVLGVRARKVKALVYQARQALMAAAGARAIPCRSIREELAVASGAARRRRHLRDHVARCEGCRAYSKRVAAQRASLAAILPVVPTVALRDAVLACIGGGGAAAATGGAGAGLGALGSKLLAITAIGGAAAGGGTVAVTQLERSAREPRAARHAAPAPSAPTAVPAQPAAAPVRVPADARRETRRRASQQSETRAARRETRRRASQRIETRAARREGRRRASQRTETRPARRAGSERHGTKPQAPPGLALGHAKQHARGNGSAGQGAGKSQAAPKPPGPLAAKPARGQPVASGPSAATPGQTRKPEPALAEVAPPGQGRERNEPQGPVKTR